jgi:hypothetical protein
MPVDFEQYKGAKYRCDVGEKSVSRRLRPEKACDTAVKLKK